MDVTGPISALPKLAESPDVRLKWRVLEWDSEQFGMLAARIEELRAQGDYWQARAVLRAQLQSLLAECRRAGVRHLTARVDSNDLAVVHALEEADFELVDAILTFEISLDDAAPAAPPGTRLFRPDDMEEILAIARSAFRYDRFHADPSLPDGVADRLHEMWTRNCCLGIAANTVLVAEEKGRLASFVTCRVDRCAARGTIVLVASAEWARGRGAGRRASLAALHWFAEQGMKSVEVGTQLRNVPAARLYESLGFKLARTSLTFRRTL